MKNRVIAITILLAIAGVFISLYYLFVEPYLPTYDWKVSLKIDDEEPYGAYFLYQTLSKSLDEEFVLVDESLTLQLDSNETRGVYLFLGNYIKHGTREKERLLEFVQQGNQAFFAVSNPDEGWDIISEFVESPAPCSNYIERKEIAVMFESDSLAKPFRLHYQFMKDTASYKWWYFDSCLTTAGEYYTFAGLPFDSGNVNVLSRINNQFPNMISFRYGKGEVVLHANPIMFSNYYLVHKNGYTYVNQCFEPFAGKTIYWDEAGKKSRLTYSSEGSIFKFIFSKKGLKWAWFIVLAALALFLIFNSKRSQKIIPLLPEKQNTSALFVKAVALLYKSSGSHHKIAAEMTQQFLQFVRLKYGIRVKLNATDKYVPELAKASGVDEPVLRWIFNLNMLLEVSNESENKRLKALNENLEKFYQNCK